MRLIQKIDWIYVTLDAIIAANQPPSSLMRSQGWLELRYQPGRLSCYQK